MNRILVWDLPTRLFHWLFAAAFAGAFGVALLTDDETPAFSIHMVLGLVMLALVVLRVIWGVVGPRYARFGSFVFGPSDTLGYFAGLFSKSAKRHIGHNPGSAAAIFAMLLSAVGLAVTGLLTARGGEAFKEVHEVFAYLFATIAGAHVLGVLIHTVAHKENLTLSMIDGRKQGEPAEGIPSTQLVPALAMLALVGAWSWRLLSGYDGATGALNNPLTGQTLVPGGQGEGSEGGGAEHGHRGRDADGDDDDD